MLGSRKSGLNIIFLGQEVFMPYIDSKVSVKVNDEQKKKLKEGLGQAIACIPGKSESWLMVNLSDAQDMYFKGENNAPSAYVAVSVYGKDDPAGYAKMTQAVTKLYGDVLGIPADRVYVKYDSTMNWGWNGSNF